MLGAVEGGCCSLHRLGGYTMRSLRAVHALCWRPLRAPASNCGYHLSPHCTPVGLKQVAHCGALSHSCGTCLPPAQQCGYLYLSDPERLHAMMGLLGLGDDDEAGASSSSGGSAPAPAAAAEASTAEPL